MARDQSPPASFLGHLKIDEFNAQWGTLKMPIDIHTTSQNQSKDKESGSDNRFVSLLNLSRDPFDFNSNPQHIDTVMGRLLSASWNALGALLGRVEPQDGTRLEAKTQPK